ncbi:hypothetical protein GGC65_001759 [Sphingopyxis sp. OAS728]|nr:hypothetical protein [Sphingopyxis sp. OAS728]
MLESEVIAVGFFRERFRVRTTNPRATGTADPPDRPDGLARLIETFKIK